MIHDIPMDNMLNDIVDIFTQVQGVELVRLHGLTRRAQRISNMSGIDEFTLNNILNKMKKQGIINWRYSYQCPQCGETYYQIKDVPNDTLKICDTCQHMFIPKDHLQQEVILI